MRQDDLRASDNVEDRRGSGLAVRGGGLGLGAVVVLTLLGWALGINPAALIDGAQMVAGGDTPSVSHSNAGRAGAPTDQMGNFVARVLGETEDVWSEELPRQANRPYGKPI